MRIVIAPDSFKEALPARACCAAIARGVRRVIPDAELISIPMADGGEGTVDALLGSTPGTLMKTLVHGPLGDQVEASWALIEGSPGSAPTAIIEMAEASGLALVPEGKRNPLITTTLGTGELVRAALDAGASRIIIGIGGSATTDGGAGAAQALGVRFLDSGGSTLPAGIGGGALAEISRIDLSARNSRLSRVRISAACDVANPLCGPRGAAAVFAPQKGAALEQVPVLDANLAHLADLIARDLGRDVRDIPGAGAAGGLGAGLMAFFDAQLESGVALVLEAARFRERTAGADLIITGEGRIDHQSLMGKVVGGVARAGREAGIPVLAMVGAVGPGAEACLEVLHSYHAITPAGLPLPEAMARTAEFLENTAADVVAGWAKAGKER